MSLSFNQILSHDALIRGKARAFTHNHQDREDLAHDLFVHVAERAHRYDPDRGLVGAFLARVIDRKLQHIAEARRAQCRDSRRIRQIKRLDLIVSPTRDIDLRLDLSDAIDTLPLPERTTALALSTYTVAEVARLHGVDRSRVRRHVARIRDHFRAHGIADGIDRPADRRAA